MNLMDKYNNIITTIIRKIIIFVKVCFKLWYLVAIVAMYSYLMWFWITHKKSNNNLHIETTFEQVCDGHSDNLYVTQLIVNGIPFRFIRCDKCEPVSIWVEKQK